jgi:HAE1 family hydrophobic/amphiphilic exporter-1
MSFLSRLSMANRSIVALVTVAILLVGAYIIPTLKQELLPPLSFPAISIVTIDPGTSPANIEQEVTDPLEKNIQNVQGLQQYTSYSNQGESLIIVEYDYNTDLNQASQTLEQQINKTQPSLPSNVTPQIETFDISSQPIIRMAVSSSANQQDLAVRLNQDVVPVLQGISGVGNVTVTGVRQQIVTVTLDLTKLQNDGLTVSQVEGALQANNITVSAGQTTNNGQTVTIQTSNALNSIQDLENVIVGVHSSVPGATGGAGLGGTGAGSGGFAGGTGAGGTGTGGTSAGGTGGTGAGGAGLSGTSSAGAGAAADVTPVKLSDVATVQETLAPSTTLTRTNGKDSLGISVTKTSSGNTVSISQAIKKQIPDLEKKLGSNAQITIVSDQALPIQTSINELVREGLTGAGFAILVILLFLLSIRSTLVTAVSIPLSVVIALIGLWAGNFSLNLLTLGGLTIAIGRVVDDSIVVLENIYRHLYSGEDKRTAVLLGVREVAGAITASTITTVAVFLPIAFTSGIVGEFFQPFSLAVTIALLASLFVALTIIPVLAYWFMKGPEQRAGKPRDLHGRPFFLEGVYVAILRGVTKIPIIPILLALLILVGSFRLIPLLPTDLYGNGASNNFDISLQLPATSSLDATNRAAEKVENVLKGIKGIQTYQVTVGSSGAAFSLTSSGANTASFAVTTDNSTDEPTIQNEVQNQLKTLSGIGTVDVSGGGAAGAGGNTSQLTINVQAGDDQTLRQATNQVMSAIANTPNLTNVNSSLVNAAPLINVSVDSQKAIAHDLTAAQVGQLLRMVYTGTTVMQVTFNGTQQNVNLQFGNPANTVTDMQNLLLPTATGTVRLGDIATVQQVNGPTEITHINGSRTATITGTVTSQNVGGVSNTVQSRINKLSLPAGASASLGGVTTQQQQAFQSLGLALIIAIILVYIVMVATFRSLLQPLILLVSIPFAGTGSILLLLQTHTALGLPALIGLLMLVGIVVTNAIVLLDLVNQYRKKGLDARSAVIEGGRRRLRPILMTAIATVLALTPMALNPNNSSGFISGPLAVVVIGGLTSSTILTLLIVPALYTVVEGIRGRSGALPPEEGTPVVAEAQKQPQTV